MAEPQLLPSATEKAPGANTGHMKIVHERPPNYEAILKAGFKPPIGALFAWGDKIYNPSRLGVPLSLQLHEAMHGDRQLLWHEGVEGWWHEYLRNGEFRLYEETLAHQVEYRCLMRGAPGRNARRHALKRVASRLASPLYGNLISVNKAKLLMKAADVGTR